MAEETRNLVYVAKVRDEASSKFKAIQKAAVETYDLKPTGKVSRSTDDIFALKPLESFKKNRSAFEQQVRDAMAEQVRAMRDAARAAKISDEAHLRLFGLDQQTQDVIKKATSAAKKNARDAGTATGLGYFSGLKTSLGRGSELGQTLAILKGGGAIAGVAGLVSEVGNLAAAQQQYFRDLEAGMDLAEARINRLAKLAPLGIGEAAKNLGEHFVDSMLSSVEGMEDGWKVNSSQFFMNLIGLGDQDKKIIAAEAKKAAEQIAESYQEALKDAMGKVKTIGETARESVEMSRLAPDEREKKRIENDIRDRLIALDEQEKKIRENRRLSGDADYLRQIEEVEDARVALAEERANRIAEIEEKQLQERLKRSQEIIDKEQDAFWRAVDDQEEADRERKRRNEQLHDDILRFNKLVDDDAARFFEEKPFAESRRAAGGTQQGTDTRYSLGIAAASAEGMMIKSGAATARNTERMAKGIDQLVAASGAKPVRV